VDGEIKKESFQFEVKERQYTKEEIKDLFERASEELDRVILGDNESFDHVDHNLKLVTTLQGYPYSFRLSDNAYIDQHPADGEKYWIDIKYPTLNATIHCSYKPIRNNFRSLSQDAQEFLYKHSTVASAIPVQEYANPSNRVWGLYWELHGNTASPIQFVLTDSIEHFFRGSVYCNDVPNRDSLAPIYEYIEKDVRVLIESMRWQ
jgi:gliding motility-associated lipoprotein GldD